MASTSTPHKRSTSRHFTPVQTPWLPQKLLLISSPLRETTRFLRFQPCIKAQGDQKIKIKPWNKNIKIIKQKHSQISKIIQNQPPKSRVLETPLSPRCRVGWSGADSAGTARRRRRSWWLPPWSEAWSGGPSTWSSSSLTTTDQPIWSGAKTPKRWKRLELLVTVS